MTQVYAYFNAISKAFPQLLKGTLITLQITALTVIIGLSLGTLCGIVRYRNTYGSSLVTLYVTVIRGTPMLLHIMFLFYVFAMAGVGISAFASAAIAIGINSGAYITEIVRSGMESVDKGQIEAAHTLCIPQNDITRYIILPQAFATILPALGNEVVTLVKDSSLASVIGVMELYSYGKSIVSVTYDVVPIYGAVAFIYLIITSSISYMMSCIERWMQSVC